MLTKLLSKNFLLLAICFIIAFLAYIPSFQAPFEMDDNAVIVENDVLHAGVNPSWIWQGDPSRFLTHLTFAVNYRLGGLNVFGYHVVNFGIHMIVCLVVFFLARLTLELAGGDDRFSKMRSDFIVFFCVFIFALHPIQTSAVTYVVQRATLLASLFYVLGLVFYLSFRLRGGYAWYFLSLICVFAGLFCKPIIFTFPLAVLLYEVCFFADIRFQKRNLLKIVPFAFLVFLVPVLLMLWKYRTIDLDHLLNITRETTLLTRREYLFTQFRVLVTYLRLLFFPVYQNLDYDYPVAEGFFQPTIFLSFCFLMMLFWIGLRMLTRNRLVAFGIFWFFATLTLESSIFPITDVIFEHRLYLPMFGFALVLPSVIIKLIPSRWITIGVCIGLISSYSFLTFQRNVVWSDKLEFFKDMARKSPKKARIIDDLGFLYYERGDIEQAFAHFNRALKLKPDQANTYNHRGIVYYQTGQFDLALADFSRAIVLDPRFFSAYSNRANLYKEMGMPEQALADYDQAVSLNPNYAKGYYNRAILYSNMAKTELALGDYSAAIAIDPHYQDAYYNRGNLHKGMENYDSALKDFERALQLDPQNVAIYNNRGNIYGVLGRMDSALAEYQKALDIDPGFKRAYFNRAIVYKKLGKPDMAIADLTRSLEIDARQADAYFKRGNLFESIGQWEKAVADYSEILKINPNHTEALNNRGALYAMQAQREKAFADFNQVIVIQPKHSRAYYNRSRLYQAEGNYTQALHDALQAQSLGHIIEEDYLQSLRKALQEGLF